MSLYKTDGFVPFPLNDGVAGDYYMTVEYAHPPPISLIQQTLSNLVFQQSLALMHCQKWCNVHLTTCRIQSVMFVPHHL